MNLELLNDFLIVSLFGFFVLGHEFCAVGGRGDCCGDLFVESFEGGFGDFGGEEDDFVAGGRGEGEEEGDGHLGWGIGLVLVGAGLDAGRGC